MIQRRISHARTRSRNGGFSLVELMLALALGLIVVTGIVQLFVGNSRTYNVLNGQARMQENARFAMDFIARATRSAGYFGCANQSQSMVTGLAGGDLANLALRPEFNVSRPVEGHDAAGAGWTPPLATLPSTVGGVNNNTYQDGTGIDTSEIIAGTDVLVVRSLASDAWPLQENLPGDGEPLISDTTGIEVDDVVMVANCEQAAMFRVTGMPADGAGAVRLEHAAGGTLSHNSPTVLLPNGTVGSFTLAPIGGPYRQDSIVSRVETTFFFIAEGAAGNGVRALWQKVGRNAPVELIQGVEDLQVLYGIDTTLTDGTPNANEYVTADALDFALANDGDVVSVRVSVTANSVDAVSEAGDPLRRTFATTILLRNSDPEAV